jgi:hypothetical protein
MGDEPNTQSTEPTLPGQPPIEPVTPPPEAGATTPVDGQSSPGEGKADAKPEQRDDDKTGPSRPPQDEIRAREQQPKNRAENQDYLRVIGMYGGGSVPPVYVANVNVAQDFVLGQRGAVSTADVFPPESRDSAEVSGEELGKIKQVYQRPAAYPTALRYLRDKRCVVVRGKPHVGKRAAAIRLALEIGDGKLPVWELSGEEDLANHIHKLAQRPDTIYLIDGLLREQGRVLKSTAARNLLKSLVDHNCYLIICARPDVPFPADLAVVDFAPPISITALVEVHLDFYGAPGTSEIRSAVEHSAIAEVLEKGLSPLQADRLAYQLSQALHDGQSPEIALRGLAAATEDEVHEWVQETADDVEDSAFRISLAVFNGARYAHISEATQSLLHRLRPEPEHLPKDEPRPAYVSPLKKKDPLSIKLQKARAKPVARTEPTEYSETATIEVIELEDPGYPRALLKYLWQEIDEWRQPLLDWLCAYAIHAPRDLRLRAAGAIGALAGLDFDYIRTRVFLRWALDDKDPDRRRDYYQALSNALGVLIWDDTHAEDALGLLRAWIDDGREALKWAAARAYAQVGLRYPREAIDQWRRILESKGKVHIRLTESLGIVLPHPLHMSVIDAIVSLFLRATEFPHRLRPVYEQALDGLADWIEADAKDRNAEQVGLPLFLALTMIGYPPEDNSGDPNEWPPAMLYIVGTQPDSHYRRVLAALLRRALNHEVLWSGVHAALQEWTEAAEKDQWLERTLGALLKEMLNLPEIADWERKRERGRLKVFLNNLAKRHKDPLAVAQRLLDSLQLT